MEEEEPQTLCQYDFLNPYWPLRKRNYHCLNRSLDFSFVNRAPQSAGASRGVPVGTTDQMGSKVSYEVGALQNAPDVAPHDERAVVPVVHERVHLRDGGYTIFKIEFERQIRLICLSN